MTAAIMQPYLFPYIGYFQLIANCDRFILFDDVQYIRHGWINRNRILKPGEGWQYIVMPLQKHSREDCIKDITAVAGDEWKIKIVRQLEHYKRRAPHYKEVCALLGDCFTENETNITKLNGAFLKKVCDYIGIPFTIEISSHQNFDYSNVADAGEWALRICEQIGATEYINPPGGQELFDKPKFAKSNINIRFLQSQLSQYTQLTGTFEPGLSIIDVLMFNTPARVTEMLSEFSYL